ncbi:hypothetical protein KC19_12G024700 [Ceratodon purpureus]|uniref:Uncharacterized protein n=1 Tax=Ceratodon purpureus TaxID=3225 RepID=A0A8T0G3W7_CERPU|nr:hypothetical protein KC19_12G024700 [Ceratodon purpureus]
MGHGSKSPQVQVMEGLQRGLQKEIPCSLLYDDRGSELYEKITELEEYYPFRVEEYRLKEHAREICEAIPEDSVIVELGCGTARKSRIVLSAVQSLRGRCRYVGIDVSSSFLQEARSNLVEEGIDPECIEMVEGEYMQGLKEVRAMHPDENLCIMWLGSSVGNFTDEGAIQFFRDIHSAVGTRCQIFLCADMWKDNAKLYAAYHDKKGVTELFIKNGMRVALSLLGHTTTAAEEEKWIYEVVVNDVLRRVEMYLKFTEEMVLPDHNIHIMRGERVLVEVSRKFTCDDFNRLANEAGFHIDVAWRDSMWGMQMLIPFREAFERCWKQTDAFFNDVPDWCMKPIDVRHPFKFYYGHIQAFAKLKLRPDEPSTPTDVMFSRGIDPNVVDPTKCHSHPEVPPEWPSRAEIEDYVQKTRVRILTALAAGEISSRLAILAIEHEYMHLETLAYMRAQDRKATFEKKMRSNGNTTAVTQHANGTSNGVAKPYVNGTSNGTAKPHVNGTGNGTRSNGSSNGVHKTYTNGAANGRVHNVDDDQEVKHEEVKMVEIPAGKVTLGGDPSCGTFMWDNEYPALTTTVSELFRVSCKPVTVAEFLTFIKEGGYTEPKYWKPLDFAYFQRQKITKPATWSEIDGDYFVHSAFATQHWTKVGNEPVYTSLSEAEAFCAWSGGRVMTEPEYHRILSTKEGTRVEKIRSGGWEWTSTLLEPFPGFVMMPEYPEYSSDFFDGSHYVLKGASPVTHRCMWRDTFRNFYQRQYPYVFAKFRVCKNATVA